MDPELKGKIVGAEGTLDQQVRFEEAKKKDLTAVTPYPKPADAPHAPLKYQPSTCLWGNRTC